MADATQPTPETSSEVPLFTYTYELSNALVVQMAGALAGDRNRNPPAIAVVVLLACIVFLAATPGTSDNTPLLVALVIVTVVLMTLATRWRDLMVRSLRAAGFDTALAPEGQRRYEVSVFEDRFVVAHGSDLKTTLLVSDLRRPRPAKDVVVLRFSGKRYLPVPRKALSGARYNELLRFVAARTGAKFSE